MAWKDYETLDVTPETATREELEKLYLKYGLEYENKERPVNKGETSKIFKKWLFCNLSNNQSRKKLSSTLVVAICDEKVKRIYKLQFVLKKESR